MPNLNENTIEQLLIDLLQKQDYQYFYGPEIAPSGKNPKRENFSDVILLDDFKKSLRKINPEVPESAIVETSQKILNLGSSDLMENNEKFHNYLSNGVTIEYFKDGETKTEIVKLLDLQNIENNNFYVVNQFIVKENNNEKRLDLVVFVNGLPLVIFELKNPLKENATLYKAWQQIQNYKQTIPSIFYYNALCVIGDGMNLKVGSLSAPFSRFLQWKSPIKDENKNINQAQILAERMLEKQTLLKLIRFNTVFEKEEVKDEKTGTISIKTIKKVAAYHQYYAVQKAVNETLKAVGGEKEQKIGVVWHTQGSGKSLSMVFYTGQIVVEPLMENPTIVVLTDRNDLDDQLFQTFSNCKSLLRQTPVQAKSREHIKELLKVAGGGIVFTTIQKFFPEDGKSEYETLSERKNIVVIADEAHRSQYGFKAKLTDDGKVRYGNAKYIRDALPNASFIGFTGTPIETKDKNTRQVFGDYIDIYDIASAVKDGATVPIFYESRLAKIKANKEVLEQIDKLIAGIEDATEEQIEKAKAKVAKIEAVVGNPSRLKDLAKDIVNHFEARQKEFEGKAMIVCMIRKIAVDLYNEIIALRPSWHSDDLKKGAIKVVMTSSSSDPESFIPHHTTKKQRKELALRFKDPKDELKIVIVRDMWLTGFDAPVVNTMYIDKKMQGANLMQAIARVNRVYKDKTGGLIVDYIGIGQELRNAMGVYTQSGGKGEMFTDIREAIAGMKAKFEVVEQMFHGFDYKKFFKVDTNERLNILLQATNFILSSEDLKNRFLKEVTALNKLFTLSVPSKEADLLKEEIAFFNAVKTRINKLSPNSGKSDEKVETIIKQIVNESLSSSGVVSIFEEVGINTKSLEILSDEFLLEVKNLEQKNLAYEMLRKVLNDEIKVRKRKNIAQSRRFSEMMEKVVNKYHNNQIDTAQVIEELVEIAKQMKLEDNKAKDLGLTPEEYAFYSVLKENNSTNFLEDKKMKELIHTIVEIIRKNATVDWEKREDVRAKLRLTVRKILMRYGYPPDLARMEADKVIEQSELLAGEFVK